MASVGLNAVIEKMNLVNLTPEIDVSNIEVTQPDLNRPALQLTGYFDHFDGKRIQAIGYVEKTYIDRMSEKNKAEIYSKFFEFDVPTVVFCRGFTPDKVFKKMAIEAGVPILQTEKRTSIFMAEMIRWLNVKLAPSISIHGVLVDVYGVGVLITGESGIGKSEAALELIHRGHRLVSDDVVTISKVSNDTLVGTAPEITKHFIELRGIGIIDVKTLYGVSSVRNTQNIDLVIELEEWNKESEYDRFGLNEDYIEYLGNRVVLHKIPIRPGRNLAVIVESAAVNYRQKAMGYNAAQELYNRVQHALENNAVKKIDDI